MSHSSFICLPATLSKMNIAPPRVLKAVPSRSSVGFESLSAECIQSTLIKARITLPSSLTFSKIMPWTARNFLLVLLKERLSIQGENHDKSLTELAHKICAEVTPTLDAFPCIRKSAKISVILDQDLCIFGSQENQESRGKHFGYKGENEGIKLDKGEGLYLLMRTTSTKNTGSLLL